MTPLFLVARGPAIISVITKSSAESLGLSVGQEACAVTKASEVMIATEKIVAIFFFKQAYRFFYWRTVSVRSLELHYTG